MYQTVLVHFPATGETYPIDTTCKTWPHACRQARAKALKILGWPIDETKVIDPNLA